MAEKTRILVIEFNASRERLDFDAESANVKRKLLMSSHGRDFAVEEWRNAGLDDLARQMRQFRPHILHIRGHGDEKGPILRRIARSYGTASAERTQDLDETDSESRRHLTLIGSTATPSDAAAHNDGASGVLDDLLVHFPDLRCVLLLCCHSHRQAEQIAARQSCVIGVHGAIDDHAAGRFTIEFFAALGDGASVASAFSQAQTLVRNEQPHEAARLALFAGHEDPEQLLFAGAQPGRVPSPRDSERDALVPFHVNFPENIRFQGRQQELTALHRLLQESGNVGINTQVTTRSAAGLTGMGGIGKTQLAVAYAYHRRSDYPGGIFLINAAEDILPQLLNVARLLKLKVSDPERADINEQLISALHDYLLEQPKTLLICDNVEEPALLLRRRYGPLTLPELGGVLLITTRSRQLPAGMARFSLDTLENEPDAACAIITTARPDLVDDALLDPLCARLGYLPLGLNLAACVLRDIDDLTIADYLAELEAYGLDDLTANADVATLEDYAYRGLRPVLRRQWEQLQSDERNRDACALFQTAGQLGEAAFIPVARLSLLTAVRDSGKIRRPLSRALERLEDLYLIERMQADAVRLHPLIRDFAATTVPVAAQADFRRGCARHMAAAYADLQRLVDEIAGRDVAAVQQDLLVALELAHRRERAATPAGEKDTELRQLTVLNRLLQREAHSLRPEASRTQLAQQLAYRIADRGLRSLTERAGALLAPVDDAHFVRQWAWRNESLAVERTLRGHDASVMSVAVYAEGRKAISASSDSTLIVWDLETGKPEQRLQGHEGTVMWVAVYAEGRKAISASSDGTLIVWDLETGKPEQRLRGHDDWVRSVAVYAKGRKAISASSDSTLIVWDLETGKPEQRLRGHDDWVRSVAVYAEGRKAISASDDRTLIVWDLETGKQEQRLQGHKNRVMSAAVYSEGRKAISASSDRTLIVWDLETGKQEQRLRGHKGSVRSVAVYAEGRKAISASSDRTLIVWDLETGKPEQQLRGHEGTVRLVAVHVEGRKAISASDDRTLNVWNLETGEQGQRLRGHEDWVRSLVIYGEERKAISASDDSTLIVWNLETGEPKQWLRGHDKRVMSVAVYAKGRKAISASDDSTLIVWNLETGEPKQWLRGHDKRVMSVAVYSGGRKAISASDDRTLIVWNLETGEPEQRLQGHKATVRSVAVYSEGRKAISASYDSTLIVWDLETGEPEQQLRGHEGWVMSVAVYGEGCKAISASSDGTLIVWNLETGEPEQRLLGHDKRVSSVAVYSEGCKAISASDDSTLIVWNLETGAEIASVVLDGQLTTLALSVTFDSESGGDEVTVVAGDRGGGVYCLRLIEP